MAAIRYLLRAILAPAIGALLIIGMTAAATEPPASEAAALSTVNVPEPVALDAETKCLALAVYWEGRAESRTGQLAIAHTVLNRTRHGEFPDTICGVVAQTTDSGKSCQFSWWCDGKQDMPDNDEMWEASVKAAREARDGSAKDPTGGALFFHSARIDPKWGGKRKRLARIGNHIFYR